VVSQEKLGIREQLEKKVSKVVLDLKDLVDLLDPLGLLEQQAHKEEMARPV
jgi:sensor domain CHASE-containing protein